MQPGWIRGCFLSIAVVLPAVPTGAAAFLRGDAGGDGKRSLDDAVEVLGSLFLADPAELPCDDAADANDDGSVDLADAVHLLAHLYLGAGPLAEPFESCGEDPSEDAISCEVQGTCPSIPCGGIAGRLCPKGYTCDVRACCCDIAGVCVPLPQACPKIYKPVCGCDRVTYSNDCERLRAGAALDHEGPCEE
jgi:hypothetical protein